MAVMVVLDGGGGGGGGGVQVSIVFGKDFGDGCGGWGPRRGRRACSARTRWLCESSACSSTGRWHSGRASGGAPGGARVACEIAISSAVSWSEKNAIGAYGWCGGALKRQQSAGGGVTRAAALFPLDVRAKKQKRPRLVHMKRILPDGAVECFGPISKGQELRLNSRKIADIPASVRELVVNAAKAATSPVKLALVDVCAGSASTLPDLDVLTKEVEAGLAASLTDPPQFLCFFTFGEQGMVDGRPQHCNLMVNVALFG